MWKKIHSETFRSNQATKSPGASSDTHDYKHNIKHNFKDHFHFSFHMTLPVSVAAEFTEKKKTEN